MPRGRKPNTDVERLSPEAAKSVLQRLVREGRVTAGEVSKHVADEIAELRERLSALAGHAAPSVRRAVHDAGAAVTRAGRKAARKARRAAKNVSPERRAAMAVQGRYLSVMRRLSTKDREILRRKFKAATTSAAKDSVLKSYK